MAAADQQRGGQKGDLRARARARARWRVASGGGAGGFLASLTFFC